MIAFSCDDALLLFAPVAELADAPDFACVTSVEQFGDSMLVNLVFDYYTDIVDVSDFVAEKLKKYQNKCDKWLFNKGNDHDFWVLDESENKRAISSCSEAFVYYLNHFVLQDDDFNAEIVKKDLSEYDKSLPTIFF